jgi:hypothetical protein
MIKTNLIKREPGGRKKSLFLQNSGLMPLNLKFKNTVSPTIFRISPEKLRQETTGLLTAEAALLASLRNYRRIA